MRQRHRLNLLLWAALLVVAGLEFAGSRLSIPVDARSVLTLPAVVMTVMIALGYMRLRTAPHIARGFAIAGMFWLIVLLGLAMIDPLTRVVFAVTK
jgi:caa(3)-type oxidase subunit IV